ncbi:MAG: hypothetical protein C0518_05155 [Opitutus sp.]|nr:hypothetical protein [Opitutus sp.]
MNKSLRFVALVALSLPIAARAVYAPIPEQEQGKALIYRLGGSVYHDSNIFGAATGEIDSMVYSATGSISYNGSVNDQTFATASYDVTFDHIADRPGKKNLTSHALLARVAHAFTSATNIDVSDRYMISKNPQSLLAGIPLNSDQSFTMNEFNARFATNAGQKTGLVFKYRNLAMAYDTAALAVQLDRMENLFGAEMNFALLPETKILGEYRYLDIAYDTAGNTKDKQSHFLLAGVDYNPGQEITLSARAGFEDRTREGAADTTSPYLELSARYGYAEGSFFTGGYTFAIEEASDVTRFTDTRVNRLFLNVQHRISGAFTASSSFTIEPSKLQGRAGQTDLDETTTRFGAALSWIPTKNWVITGTYDRDHVASDDNARDQERGRYGVSARLSF